LPSSWTIILFWTGSNALSIFGGILLGAFLNEILWTPNLPPGVESFITNPVQRAFIFGLSIGGIKSLLEAFVLQRWKIKWNGWIPINMLGWAFGVTFAVGLAVFHLGSGINELLGGMIIGLSQWIVLRRYLPKAYWWIIANVVGGFVILSYIPLGNTFLMMLESFILFLIAGLFIGIMTGAMLSWLLALLWLEEQ
jgi:hypothetical protein